MKIVIALPHLTRLGGAARYAWELGEFMHDKKDEIIITSLYADDELYNSKKFKIINLVDRNFLPQSIKFWLNLSKIQKKFSDIIEDEKPDIILFNHFPCTLWAKKFKNIPVLCYPHDIELLFSDTYIKDLSFFTRTLWRIIRIFVQQYDKKRWKEFDEVIANSNYSAKTISQSYDVMPSVIYPGTNTSVFRPIEKNLDEKTILVNADNRVRRAHFALKNLKKLLHKRQDFKIWVVGHNPTYDRELKELVKKEKMEKFVTFFGRVSDSKLRELYAKAHIFLMLQRKQPFGLVFIEAMSSGTPVIACKPGAPEEVLNHGETGFVFDQYDGDEMNQFVERILDNPELSVSMGQKGRQRVEENFESTAQYEKLRNLMDSWIKKQKNIM
ncbi:glycosyltransferase family 4 protein [Nitrosopumilus sp. b2]|uniref:glycosyltransferase family 4 protein n=1 Tax=Nitrosopumilus sp. b2 TaxID=2109908 RepID=UPI0015F76A77|nr:glycosyltransferase family 4 protein [Nitrosopumilus sp. b2]KAF6245752.1 hypothetical protein C6989_01035 [Nitrosopumilus sp. b2]